MLRVQGQVLVLVLVLFAIVGPSSGSCVGPSNISFPSFTDADCNSSGKLLCLGAYSVGNGTLSLTPDSKTLNQISRVLYRQPILAWPASICTTFTVRILVPANASGSGDGMAFVLAQDNKPSPSSSFGSFLGMFDQSNEGSIHQLSVEFDTYKNEFDPDQNHIGIDTKSVEESVAVKSLNSTGISLTSGRAITVRIEYDGWSKNFMIYVGYAGDPLVTFLNHTIKLKGTVPSSVYVGFTASTGTLTETHQILSWNFTSSELPRISLGKEKNMTVIITLPIIAGLLLLALLSVPFVRRARRKKRERLARRKEIEALVAAANGPKLFSHRKLKRATRNFSRENLLGTGGFGSVYRGVISNPPMTIAVKRISATAEHGEKQYLAEICTIGQLRHRNLVQLQGWCHDRDQLLLVYEYMPNRSLDQYIGKAGAVLDWPTRYKILTGLASALVYLHEECGQPVVHRDVKPNNVMLDSDFNAHLGDFGLARLLRNDASMTTTNMAGTPGYLAPEVSFTGRPTTESDVYSFGMVVLEVVCGTRSRGIMEEDSLVDNVWSLYEKAALLDCVDKMLEGKYDEEQVRRTLIVGLACLFPDSMVRPKMRKVVQIFMNPDEPLVYLPETRPAAIWLPLTFSTSTSAEFGPHSARNEGSVELPR
ncbi:probable L-type lectin-domain containing receptor kinase S.5 [Diospyros lotus]|uniref:probable L-type lectin-domain containing receptor kinase S.5 n=1 Tax=Diospyros lotus TaxID=55363 RepID=UPI0022543B1D|nr:probable L-type lectin-domain containing receptor kinase S.5 [Diospyros lotus]